MVKTTTKLGNGLFAFQLDGETIRIPVRNETMVRAEADSDMMKCRNRPDRRKQADEIRKRLKRNL